MVVLDTWPRYISVSYTHLDVYKRQHLALYLESTHGVLSFIIKGVNVIEFEKY